MPPATIHQNEYLFLVLYGTEKFRSFPALAGSVYPKVCLCYSCPLVLSLVCLRRSLSSWVECCMPPRYVRAGMLSVVEAKNWIGDLEFNMDQVAMLGHGCL